MKYPAPDSDFAALLKRMQISASARSPWHRVAPSQTFPSWAEKTGRWETLLRSCAVPSVCIKICSNEAGEPGWREAFLVSDGSWALLTRGSAESTLEGVDNLAQGWERALQALGWNHSGADCGTTSFSLPAYVALLASADTVHASHARAYLARKVPARPVLVAQFLEEELASGLASQDTRWSVTAAARCRPELVQACRGQLQTGLQELQALGLAQPVQRGLALSETGERLVEPLSRLKAILDVDDGHLAASLFVGEESAWLAEFSDTVRVRDPRDLHSLPNRLGKVASPSVKQPSGPNCPGCQSSLPEGSRFCTKCGQALSKVCGKCQRPAASGDRFCGGCGSSLA